MKNTPYTQVVVKSVHYVNDRNYMVLFVEREDTGENFPVAIEGGNHFGTIIVPGITVNLTTPEVIYETIDSHGRITSHNRYTRRSHMNHVTAAMMFKLTVSIAELPEALTNKDAVMSGPFYNLSPQYKELYSRWLNHYTSETGNVVDWMPPKFIISIPSSDGGNIKAAVIESDTRIVSLIDTDTLFKQLPAHLIPATVATTGQYRSGKVQGDVVWAKSDVEDVYTGIVTITSAYMSTKYILSGNAAFVDDLLPETYVELHGFAPNYSDVNNIDELARETTLLVSTSTGTIGAALPVARNSELDLYSLSDRTRVVVKRTVGSTTVYGDMASLAKHAHGGNTVMESVNGVDVTLQDTRADASTVDDVIMLIGYNSDAEWYSLGEFMFTKKIPFIALALDV